MLYGVTTWMADPVTAKSGSAFRADMITWLARRISCRRSPPSAPGSSGAVP
jgi:hypothetical protein